MPLNVKIHHKPWRDCKGFIGISKSLAKIACTLCGVKYGQVVIDLMLIDDNTIQSLNYQFRSINKPTNVLSFAQYEDLRTIVYPSLLGDIFLCYEVIYDEAQQMLESYIDIKQAFFQRAVNVFVHGIVHLLGFDHQTDAQEDAMIAMEAMVITCFQKNNNVRFVRPFLTEPTV